MKQIAQRHRKMLVSADIAQRGNLPVVTNQANRIARAAHALQNSPLSQICDGCYGLELGATANRLKNGSWNARHSGAPLDEIRPAPCIPNHLSADETMG
jgi:hypothetical protein